MLNNIRGVVQHDSLWKKANFSEDIIIANVDTGIYICISDVFVLVSIFVLCVSSCDFSYILLRM